MPCLRPPVCVSTPSDVSAAFGHRQSSTGRSRSVLVVLHDLDGLLHTPASVRLSESSDRSPRLEGLAPVGAPRRSGCLASPTQQAGSWIPDLGSPVAGLLHPAAEQGSLRFSRPAPGSEESGCSRAGSIPGTSPESVPTGPSCHRIEPRRIFRRGCVQSRAPTRGLSRSAVRTLRRSPPASSRVLSPGPLPSCRCAPILPTRARRAFSMWALDFRALLRCRVRSAPHRCR